MSLTTPKWFITYLQASDPVAQADDISASGMTRIDTLLGEIGQISITGVANTQLNVPITFSRTYGGNSGSSTQFGFIQLMAFGAQTVTPINWWAGTWAGSPTTITGVTLSFISSAAFTSKIFNWRYWGTPF